MAPGDQRSTPRQISERIPPPARRRTAAARGLKAMVCDERGLPLPNALARWLTRVAPAKARGVVHVAVVSDAQVRGLNRQYRRHDANTDVLSFPAEADTPAPIARKTRARSLAAEHGETFSSRRISASSREISANSAVRVPGAVRSWSKSTPFLGDIVIARGVARRQARAAGHDEATELRVLALHGLLHLLGYDHERDSGQMARLERRLRRKAGLPGGLIERAAR
jgi:rRNA maturation RNase YbeY